VFRLAIRDSTNTLCSIIAELAIALQERGSDTSYALAVFL
jgi:hypothetical protein